MKKEIEAVKKCNQDPEGLERPNKRKILEKKDFAKCFLLKETETERKRFSRNKKEQV